MKAFRQTDMQASSAAVAPAFASRATVDRRETVLVYERPEFFPALAKVLLQLDFVSLDAAARTVRDDVRTVPRAIVISDAIDNPIALCSSLPQGLPKVIVASDASFAFRCAAARAGVDAIVKRPIDVNELCDWLKAFNSERVVDPISVLLIDDHVLTAELHEAVLTRAGMNVAIVNDPADSLRAIAETSPDIILMDIDMPGVDGIELAKVIRQSREYLSIPIAFLSAERDERRQMKARESGGDVFIQKPVDLMRLAGLVRLRALRAKTLRGLIERDSLTGLLNHGRFQDRVAYELERSRRTGSIFSLAMLDLDNFKAINDTYGHPAGDKVIRALSRIMTGRLRSSDVIGRYGGEEFCIALIDTPPDAARRVIDELRRGFAEIVFEEPGGSFSVTFSAGVAGHAMSDLSKLFSAADEALYRAKSMGRNTVVVAAPPKTKARLTG